METEEPPAESREDLSLEVGRASLRLGPGGGGDLEGGGGVGLGHGDEGDPAADLQAPRPLQPCVLTSSQLETTIKKK